MTRIHEPISQVALTAGERSSISSLTEWLRDELKTSSAKSVISSLESSGFSVKLGKGVGRPLSAEAKKREVRQLLNVLNKFAPEAVGSARFASARAILDDLATVPSDLLHPYRPGPGAVGRPRYDLGVVVDEKGGVKGLVFNAIIRPSCGPVARSAGSRGVEMERNQKGGFNVDLGPDVKSASFRADMMTLRQMASEKVADRAHAEQRLEALKAAGYDLDLPRSVLEVKLKDGTSQLGFFRNRGEMNQQPLTRAEKEFARELGYDPNRPETLPRDFGIGFVGDCIEFGDLLGRQPIMARKPVINAYHPVAGTPIQIEVTLASSAHFSSLYPKPIEKQGEQKIVWRMKSGGLSGELFDPTTERRYPYLYWEAMQNASWKIDHRQAFCVRGSDAAEFLESACEAFAFNAKETADFITYWLAPLEANEYNVIQFMGEAEYDRFAHMEISPTPDQTTRVFMLFERSSVPVLTGAPELTQLVRHPGFVVVEWGGCNLDEARRTVR